MGHGKNIIGYKMAFVLDNDESNFVNPYTKKRIDTCFMDINDRNELSIASKTWKPNNQNKTIVQRRKQ